MKRYLKWRDKLDSYSPVDDEFGILTGLVYKGDHPPGIVIGEFWYVGDNNVNVLLWDLRELNFKESNNEKV